MTDTEIEQPIKETADTLLEKSKGSFDDAVVIGIKEDGSVNVNTSVENTLFCHWALNKAIFELNIYEKNEFIARATAKNKDEEKGEAEPESS